MTVAELAEALQRLPPDAEVVLEAPCDRGYASTSSMAVEVRQAGRFVLLMGHEELRGDAAKELQQALHPPP